MSAVSPTEDRRVAADPPAEPDISVSILTVSTLTPLREAVLAVAAQAFAAPPWNEKPAEAVRLVDRMWNAIPRRDFTVAAAFDGPDLIGFTYGHTDDRLTTTWPAATGSPAAAEAFEVIELAVAPSYQGLGVGRRLHDALTAATPAPRLLLTHPDAPARHAYRRWGWTEVGEFVAATGRPTILMKHDPSHA